MAQVNDTSIQDATRDAVAHGILDVPELVLSGGARTELEHAIATRLLERIRDKVVLANERTDLDILRHCGEVAGDDWVKRVERLNGLVDSMNGRGKVCECGKAIVGTVVV